MPNPNKRVTIFVWMLSGFSSSDVIEISVKQCYLEIAIKLAQTVLNKGSKKIFEN